MKRTILCADTQPAVLLTTEQILQQEGYRVSIAATAEDAAHLLKAQPFDLILLDCIPNYESVIRVAKRVAPSMRVAVFTGNLALINLPLADIVLHKPVPPPVLLTAIAKLLHVSQAA